MRLLVIENFAGGKEMYDNVEEDNVISGLL